MMKDIDLSQILNTWKLAILSRDYSFFFIQLSSESLLFTFYSVTMCVYVNNILFIDSNDSHLLFLKRKLSVKFKMTNLSFISHYLKMSIKYSKNNIIINQFVYLKAILKRFDMINCKTTLTFIKEDFFNVILFIEHTYRVSDEIIYWYVSMIDSLMYVCIMIKSNITFVLSLLFKYYKNSNFTHIKAVNKMMQYIKKTIDYNIHYELNIELALFDYTDFNWVEVINNRYSTNDYVFYLCESFISWNFKRQNLVTQFSCKIEYVATFKAEKKAIWLRSLLMQLHMLSVNIFTLLLTNNQRAIALIKNLTHH